MEAAIRRTRNSMFVTIAVVAAVSAVALSLIGSNYPLFHTLIELLVAIVAFSVFTIAWHTRTMASSDYLTSIGLACLPIGVITVLHALAYKGMPVFPGNDADLPTQLWLIARSVQAVAFVAAPAFLRRPLRKPGALLAAYVVAPAMAVWAAFAGVFPVAFVEGQGLTTFKVAVEYAVIGVTLLAALGLYRNRTKIAPDVAMLLWVSMACTVVAELAFTLYADPFGAANRAGHAAHLAAFLLIYGALVQASLERPVETLFHEIRRREAALAAAYQVEHEIAETLQNAITIQPARVRGLRIAHRYLPAPGAGRIGGDFYDVFPVRLGLVAFTIGDVCGKGLAAATVTLKARSALRAVALDDPDPTHVLESVNSYLGREISPDSFVTALFGTIETDTGQVRVAVAGHPEPMICSRPDVVLPDELRSPPLGVVPDLAAGVWELHLDMGETLLLVTDGVIEAGEAGAKFGVERLRGMLAELPCQGSADDVLDAVLRSLEEFAGLRLDDDIAIMALQRG